MVVQIKPGFEWLHSLDEGLDRAKSTGKAVLLDFFNPG